MAALANILSIGIPIVLLGFATSIHFTQLPVFVGAFLGGPLAGAVIGAIGALLSSFVVVPQIPFIIGGLAILGYASGFFGKRVRPFFAGVLAWLVQAPYVALTDYVWFTVFLPVKKTPEAAWTLVATVIVLLTIEAVISSALADVVVGYLKKAKITL